MNGKFNPSHCNDDSNNPKVNWKSIFKFRLESSFVVNNVFLFIMLLYIV